MTLDELENAIQRVLIDFTNATGREIDLVRVDTRNFANLAVEVFLKEIGPAARSDSAGAVPWPGREGRFSHPPGRVEDRGCGND